MSRVCRQYFGLPSRACEAISFLESRFRGYCVGLTLWELHAIACDDARELVSMQASVPVVQLLQHH